MSFNILHITTTLDGGAGNATLRIHQSLLARGINSKVLVRYPKECSDVYTVALTKPLGFWYSTKLGRFIRRILHRVGIYTSKRDYLYANIKNLARNVFFTLPISEYTIHTHPLVEWANVVHLHWIQDFLDFPTFFKHVRKPILWTCHDMNPMMGGFHHIRLREQYMKQNGQIERVCYDIKKESLRRCKNLSLIALSTQMHELLETHEFFQDRKIYDIPNCVDTSIFTIGDKNVLRQEYGISNDVYLLIFANGFLNDSEKGLDELIKALEKINNPRLCLLCVGDGEIPETFVSVKHLPRVSGVVNMAKMYQMADMLVMPSHQEAFALTPLEAMSCGVPVVMTPVSGASDLMRDFAGEVAKDFTPDALSNAIKKAISKDYNSKMIRQHILNNYTPNLISNKYLQVYQNILDMTSFVAN